MRFACYLTSQGLPGGVVAAEEQQGEGLEGRVHDRGRAHLGRQADAGVTILDTPLAVAAPQMCPHEIKVGQVEPGEVVTGLEPLDEFLL